MDEMRMLREMYGEAAPAPHLQTRVRAQLDELAGRPRPRRFAAWLTPVWLSAAGVALTAGVTAVALLVPMSGPGAPGDPPRVVEDTGRPAAPDQQLVLSAAHQAAKQSQDRYWYSHFRHSFAAKARGETGGYVVEERDEIFLWTSRARGDGDGFYGRDIAGKPQTDADRAAWRAAGKPSSWRIESSGVVRTVTTKSGAWQPDDTKGDGGRFFLGPGLGTYTYQELQDLPADPEKLSKVFCATGGGCDGQGLMIDAFYAMAKTPLPPDVRAGLIRMLTYDPDIEAIGAVTDPLGRGGVGLRVQAEKVDGTVYNQDIIFDPETGEVFALRDVVVEPGPDDGDWVEPGRVLNYTAVVDTGWTDERPKLPL